MRIIKVGEFEIHLSEPYPIWCNIKRGNQEIYGIEHSELSDLEYAVKKAMQTARLKLAVTGDDVEV